MSEFLDMDGYGAYVWSSFAITAVVMAINIIAARREQSAVLRQLARRAHAQEQNHDA